MSSDSYNIAAEADLKPSVSRNIWMYFIILGLGLIFTTGGLIIWYRMELLKEKELKIGDVILPESQQSRAFNEAILSGKKGLFPDKKNVSIDVAMSSFLQALRQ
jgi:hypothetical protein